MCRNPGLDTGKDFNHLMVGIRTQLNFADEKVVAAAAAKDLLPMLMMPIK